MTNERRRRIENMSSHRCFHFWSPSSHAQKKKKKTRKYRKSNKFEENDMNENTRYTGTRGINEGKKRYRERQEKYKVADGTTSIGLAVHGPAESEPKRDRDESERGSTGIGRSSAHSNSGPNLLRKSKNNVILGDWSLWAFLNVYTHTHTHYTHVCQ